MIYIIGNLFYVANLHITAVTGVDNHTKIV